MALSRRLPAIIFVVYAWPALEAASLPVAFEENRGQTDPAVQFLSRSAGGDLFLMPREARIALHGRGASRSALALRLVRSNPSPVVEGLSSQAGTSNYFIGSDPAQWKTSIPDMAR